MPDYKNSKIYKLWSPEGDDIYIGCTTGTLMSRIRQHRHEHKRANPTSRILYEKYTDVRIELLEECPCDDKEELFKKESEYIKSNNNCVNKRIDSNTHEESTKIWRNNNKEYIAEQGRLYYQKIKDKTIVCECGRTIKLNDKARHCRSDRHIKLLEELK
tara:strand:- start:71 stop:547 length:477 start_codon:yes stop_codon:yes gene_type:complete